MNANQYEAIAQQSIAGPVLVAEFRNGGAEETIRWQDKVTRLPQEMKLRTFNFETSNAQVRVSLPRGAEATNTLGVDKPLVRGTQYLLAITSFSTEKGVCKATATILPLTQTK